MLECVTLCWLKELTLFFISQETKKILTLKVCCLLLWKELLKLTT